MKDGVLDGKTVVVGTGRYKGHRGVVIRWVPPNSYIVDVGKEILLLAREMEEEKPCKP